MKQKLMLSLLGLAMGLLPAQAQTIQPLIITVGDTKELTIADNMNVVLMPAGSTDTAVNIGSAASKALSVALSGSRLRVDANAGLPKNTTIYIVVKQLSKLTLEQNTIVHTRGILQTGDLEVYLENGATAHLRTTGKVKPFGIGDYEVVMNSKPINPLVLSNALSIAPHF